MASFSIVIQNKKGLHARAAALFVKEIERFQSEVWVSFGGQKVSARSIMGLMMLAAGQGSVLEIEVNNDAESAAIQAALVALIDDKFHEGE